jgi:hypothetical protein
MNVPLMSIRFESFTLRKFCIDIIQMIKINTQRYFLVLPMHKCLKRRWHLSGTFEKTNKTDIQQDTVVHACNPSSLAVENG